MGALLWDVKQLKQIQMQRIAIQFQCMQIFWLRIRPFRVSLSLTFNLWALWWMRVISSSDREKMSHVLWAISLALESQGRIKKKILYSNDYTDIEWKYKGKVMYIFLSMKLTPLLCWWKFSHHFLLFYSNMTFLAHFEFVDFFAVHDVW